jgi:hypothetical protein
MADEPDISRLRFLMKSGNSFELDGVINWEFQSDAKGTQGLKLEQLKDGTRTTLIVKTLVLSQVEAILDLPTKLEPV